MTTEPFDATEIAPTLDGTYRDPDWDRRLGHALDVLGFQPLTPAGPRLILAAAHGVHP